MPDIITEIPANEIEALKQGATGAIFDVVDPVSREQTTRAKCVAAARVIIAKIPAIIRQQGEDDKTVLRGFASIMDLDGDNFKRARSFDGVPWTAENLEGVAAIVFQACSDAGLEPYVGTWSPSGSRYGICVPLNDTGRAHADRMK